jgi:glycosyltransferase involved in cell wall biosynthesis
MRVSLALLTKNELPGLSALFDRVPLECVDEYFAVDGGSTDGTVEFYQARNVPVVTQRSGGRGEAFRVAFERARGDAVIFFSPDGNEDPADLPRFRPLLEAGFDVVMATRMVPGAHNEEDEARLPLRKWANKAFNLMANRAWNRGPFVSDSINGYRAITRRAWKMLGLDEPGYAIEYQSTIRAMKAGLAIAEFPTYEGRRIGPGGSPSLRLGLEFLGLYFRELWAGGGFCRRREGIAGAGGGGNGALAGHRRGAA